MSNVTVEVGAVVTGAQIVELQARCGSTGWGLGTEEEWDDAIQRAVGVAVARRDSELVGVGFLSGNRRHCEMSDVAVQIDARGDGVGRRIVEQLVRRSDEVGVRYLTCVRAPDQPWLEGFYASFGFEPIDFALSRVNNIKD